MRLTKDASLIDMGPEGDKLTPFRTIKLTEEEAEEVKSLGIETSAASELLLRKILDARGMGQLLYSDKRTEQWSGYVKLDEGRRELWLL